MPKQTEYLAIASSSSSSNSSGAGSTSSAAVMSSEGEVLSSSNQTEFVVGAKIKGKVKGGPATTSTITDIDAPRSWVGVSNFPGLAMTYEHGLRTLNHS